ncbi:MAG: hypothetical protein HY013_21070, partial [Candidatus Solibacter usitatus]|nr:hypothetical protein [Candidatus Solibacter usitatus]
MVVQRLPGPAKIAGNVRAIAVDQANPDIVYLGADTGGVWKSKDGGKNWTPISDFASSLAISSVVIDPNDANTIYAGTASMILKSTDAGASWTELSTVGKPVYAVAVHPGNRNIILAGTARGIERSSDGGSTWTLVFGSRPAWNVFFAPGGGTAYAAISQSYVNPGKTPVVVSRDDGLTWSPGSGTGSSALPGNSSYTTLALAPSNPNVLYAGLSDNGGLTFAGLFRSADGGASWTKLTATPPYCTPQCWWYPSLAVHPRDANIAFAGGLNLYRSLDGGASWKNVQLSSDGSFEQPYVDHHALAFSKSGDVLYVGADGGAVRTANSAAASGIAWQNLNATLAITQFYSGMSILQSDPYSLAAGAQDTGIAYFSGGNPWLGVSEGDVGWTAIDPTDTDKIYYSRYLGGVLRFSRRSHTFETLTPGLSWLVPLALDMSDPRRIYYGLTRIYQSIDRGKTWNAISPDTGLMSVIAIAPGVPDTIYAGTGNGQIWRTNNAGAGPQAGWRRIDNALPSRGVSQIAIDEYSPSIIYATFLGYAPVAGPAGHVFKSSDAGATWTDVSQNLPNCPFYDVALDPDQPGDVYVASEVGVFGGRAGSQWLPIGTGLPRTRVTGVRIHRKGRLLRVTTYGRGAWDLSLVTAKFPALSVKSTHAGGFTQGQSGAAYTIT